jgi:superfamily II DNA or RNA helicase
MQWPHLKVRLSAAPDQNRVLLAIPGVKRRQGLWTVPSHAVPIFTRCVQRLGLIQEVKSFTPQNENLPKWTWPQIEDSLRIRGEVRDFVLDGFLLPYQRNALTFSAHLQGTHFWHPTGAGKTLTALLWALLTPGPVVIVTRAASRLQFAREVQRFTLLRPYVVKPIGYVRKGETPERLSDYAIAEKRHVIVVGWEALKDHVEEIIDLCHGGSVVFDESHKGKSPKRYGSKVLPEPDYDDAERNKSLIVQQKQEASELRGFIVNGDDGMRRIIYPMQNMTMAAHLLAKKMRRRVCTTATPIKDRVRDLWAQLDLAEPGAWGTSSAWMARYADAKPGMYGGMDTRGSSNLDELRDRMLTVAHRIDYAETHRNLPPKRRQSVYVAPEDQNRASGGFKQQLTAAKKRGATAVLEVELAMAASKKRDAVLGLIEDHVCAKQKVVVFTGRRKDCDALAKKVRKITVGKEKLTVWSAHGSSTAEQRQEIIDKYMEHPGPCALVGTGDAFGEGLNLQDTDAALFVMLPYTPGQLQQWEGRFSRQGQKRPVVIYYVIAERTVDEHVADLLLDKFPAVEKVVQDTELAAASHAIAGFDDIDEETFADGILSRLTGVDNEDK